MNDRPTGKVILSRDFSLCFLSYFFLWISFDLFLLFPLFILQRGGNAVDVGLQTAIYYIPSVIVRPLAGRLLDRYGRLVVIWLGALLMSLTAVAFLLLPGPYAEIKMWMAGILFVRGIGYGAFFAAFFTYAADLSQPENRARVIGLFGISGLIASGLAPRVGEMIIARFRFDGFFVASAALSLLSLVIALFLRERKPDAGPGGVGEESGWNVFRSVTFSRRNAIVLPGAFVFGYLMASFSTFGAPYFQEMHVPSIGNFFLFYGFSAGGIRLLLGGLADRYPRVRLISFCFLVYSAGLLLLVARPVASFYLAAAAIAGAAHGILFPCMTAAAVDAHEPKNRGMITSVFSACIEVGFSSGSYLLGHAVHSFGYSAMFVSVVVFGSIFGILVLLASRPPKTGFADEKTLDYRPEKEDT